MVCVKIELIKMEVTYRMKKVFKFEFEGKEGFLSIVEKSNKYYALVQKETPKVKEIQQTHTINISYELKEPLF